MQDTALLSPLAFEHSRRNVFGTHAQMAHVWAQGKIASGRSSDGRMFFENGAIYSHGRHFMMAKITDYLWNGRRVVFWNDSRYSISTGKHQSLAFRALDSARYFVLHVADFSHGLTKENTKETLAILARGMLGEQLLAFAAIAAPELRLTTQKRVAAFREKIRREDIAAEKKNAADHLQALKNTWRHAWSLENYLSADCRTVPPFAEVQEHFRSCDAKSRATKIERILTNARRARRDFKTADLPLYQKRASNFVRYVAPIAKQWRSLAEELHQEETKESRIRSARGIAKVIESGASDWRATESNILQTALMDALRFNVEDAIEPLRTRLAAVLFARECEATHEAANPGAREVVYSRLCKSDGTITADDWINGAKGYFQSYDPTLVRREDSRLKTSQGAEVPWQHAVAIFMKAQQCRATGKAFAPNGERYKAGYFELESIDENGAIKVGCHRIQFEEMQRLAIREVPGIVQARFPLPVVLS